MNAERIDKLVLGTVNAPWKHAIGADALACKLAHAEVAADLPHFATFFMEVEAHLVLAFASAHAIPKVALHESYTSVKRLTGESNPSLEAALGGMGTPA